MAEQPKLGKIVKTGKIMQNWEIQGKLAKLCNKGATTAMLQYSDPKLNAIKN